MKNLIKKNNKGFTLVEALVTLAVFVLLEIGVTTVIQVMYRNYNQQSSALNNVDMARKVSFNFANEIRNASFGNDGSYPINQAGDNQIIFYSSHDLESGLVDRIRYFISGTTLYKGIITPSGSPLKYIASSEIVGSVETNLANDGTPIFSYYGSDFNGGGNTLSQPINVTNVKFVKINLIIANQVGNETVNSTITAGGTVRNLKTNLGN